MTRTMYDGLNTDAAYIKKIIKPGDLVAYYIDGEFAWTPSEIALFPNNEHVTITVFGSPADTADCETGDMSPADAAEWVVRQKASGFFRPTIYRSLSVMQDIRNATGPLVLGKDWDAWVADYDNNTSNVYPGAALKQFKSETMDDVSAIYDDQWPHRTAGPVAAPVTAPKWPAGQILKFGNKGNAVKALQGALSNSGLPGVRNIAIDGGFGVQTSTSLRNYQQYEELSVDGIAGNQTRAALVLGHCLNSAGQALG
jgi:hypothetical protein